MHCWQGKFTGIGNQGLRKPEFFCLRLKRPQHRRDLFFLGLQFDDVAVRECAVARGVGVDLGAVQADGAQLTVNLPCQQCIEGSCS